MTLRELMTVEMVDNYEYDGTWVGQVMLGKTNLGYEDWLALLSDDDFLERYKKSFAMEFDK